MVGALNDQDVCVKIILDKKRNKDCIIYLNSTTYEMSIGNCMSAKDTITLTKRDLFTTNSTKKIYIKELISDKMKIYNINNLDQFFKMLRWIVTDYMKYDDKYCNCSYILYNVTSHNFYYMNSYFEFLDDIQLPTIEKLIKKESDKIVGTKIYSIKNVNEFNNRANKNLELKTLEELTQGTIMVDTNQPRKRG